MKRILIVDPGDFIGGAELFCIDIMRHLKQKNLEIHLATNGVPAYLKRVPKYVVVHKIPLKRLKGGSLFTKMSNLWSSVRALQNIIRKHQIDIIQSNSIRAHILAAIAGSLARKKVLWFIHDFTFNKGACYLLSSIPKAIFYSSEAVKKDLQQKIPTKYHKKLSYIPNGFNVQTIRSRAKRSIMLRKTHNISQNTPVIGLIARIDWWKGQREFILAAQNVLETIPSARFLIIGDANKHDEKTIEYKQSIEALITEHALTDSVMITGFIKNVHAAISELDIVVHASTTPEPFGRIILEAMAVTKPVIASNMGGPAEIITANVDGVLVDPRKIENLAKEIIRLVQNKKEAARLAKNGYKKVCEHYDMSLILKKLQTHYK